MPDGHFLRSFTFLFWSLNIPEYNLTCVDIIEQDITKQVLPGEFVIW